MYPTGRSNNDTIIAYKKDLLNIIINAYNCNNHTKKTEVSALMLSSIVLETNIVWNISFHKRT
jgi:hypothetical protein